MIIDLSKDEVINLPVSSKKRAHHGRIRKCYHVFLSWSFGKYNLLSDREQHGTFPSSIPTMVGNVTEKKSFDSVNPTCNPCLYGDESRYASLLKSSTREY